LKAGFLLEVSGYKVDWPQGLQKMSIARKSAYAARIVAGIGAGLTCMFDARHELLARGPVLPTSSMPRQTRAARAAWPLYAGQHKRLNE
jgi:hypothetical protein